MNAISWRGISLMRIILSLVFLYHCSVFYRQCHSVQKAAENVTRYLPVSVQGQLRAVSMDYMPYVRTICKVEQYREATHAKRRCLEKSFLTSGFVQTVKYVDHSGFYLVSVKSSNKLKLFWTGSDKNYARNYKIVLLAQYTIT